MAGGGRYENTSPTERTVEESAYMTMDGSHRQRAKGKQPQWIVHTADKTVLSCLDPVSNLQLIACSHRQHGRDKNCLICFVCSCVHTADAEKAR